MLIDHWIGVQTMRFSIRSAIPADVPRLLPHFPRLADFELPPHRTAEELWKGDAALFVRWGEGQTDGLIVVAAAADDSSAPLGVAIVQMGPEKLSGQPSAHLEVLRTQLTS